MTGAYVCDYLRQRGVAFVVVSFSGGHDSGGWDSISYLDVEGYVLNYRVGSYALDLAFERSATAFGLSAAMRRQIVDAPSDIYEHEELSVGPSLALLDNCPPALRKQLYELEHALAAPIYDSYPSFNGDPSVAGHVVWLTEQHRAFLVADESYYTTTQREYDVDDELGDSGDLMEIY